MNPMERAPELYQNMENINRYNDTIQKICGKEKVYFVDMLDAIKKGNLEDGCHPKAEGHEKMYIKIRDFLLDKKILYNES
ncbi:SGNH/GDSL hydrolase family protein [Patescibacteria group bacterium]|nr:SGNH/GDSL hydrolase family protein [Patescibacteria group bacterium]MBU1758609.1 SGNH/GDSL hydrolase family protein [Patescibacteria group bacterium]